MSLGFSQESKELETGESNPILFAEVFLGYTGVNFEGLSLGYTVNYQFENNLITYRNLYVASKNKNRNRGLSETFIFPSFINGNSLNEYSLLYGKRFLYDNSSLSISIGVSSNTLIYRSKLEDERIRIQNNYIGVPFEVNFKFFNAEKERYRVFYGLIPIGKPTAFTRSFGLKLYGNFGKVSHLGIGINIGLGWHKKYE